MLVFQQTSRSTVASLATVWAAALVPAWPVAAQTPADLLRNAPRAQVLVLGVFHFQDAGLDSYKPQFAFDIRNAERQRELQEVLDQLPVRLPIRLPNFLQ